MNDDDFADLEDGSTAISAPGHSTSLPTKLVITVIEGPDRGRSLELSVDHPGAYLMGQSPSCDLRLSDPHVSRRHASIEVSPEKLTLVDHASTNGTFVDGVSISGAYLRGGESIRLGGSLLRMDRAAASTPRSAVPAAERGFGRVVGESRALTRLYPLFRKLAASEVPLVIEGETGTGKEVLAESIHAESPRKQGPFVVFDCTAVPPSMMEAELFGHERGAFTGAIAQRRGLFEQAHGGTLLIDEIGDLDLSLQPKLLRAIERSEIRRVGGQSPLRIDVRLLAATRRDLDREVQEGRFRDDLYHRLAVARVELPPLSMRSGDIATLAKHFWRDLKGPAGGPPAAIVASWERQAWPGNVRQLRNAVARYLALGELAETRHDVASTQVPATAASADLIGDVIAERLPLPVARLRVVEAFEARYISAVLAEHDGNVAKAADASGIARRYFQLLRTGKRRGS